MNSDTNSLGYIIKKKRFKPWGFKFMIYKKDKDLV